MQLAVTSIAKYNKKTCPLYQVRAPGDPAPNPGGEEALSPDLQRKGREVPEGQRAEEDPEGGEVQDRRDQLRPLQEVQGQAEAHRGSSVERPTMTRPPAQREPTSGTDKDLDLTKSAHT